MARWKVESALQNLEHAPKGVGAQTEPVCSTAPVDDRDYTNDRGVSTDR